MLLDRQAETALLDYAAERAGSMRILRATSFEAEAELAFGGLYALLRPLAGRLDARPRRYAALQAALGLASHDAALGRLAVAVATDELLVTAAEQQPLLLLLDDLQCASRAPRLLGFAPFRGCCVALSAGFPAAVQLLGLPARAAAIAPARSSACPSASFAGVSFRTTRHGGVARRPPLPSGGR